MIERGLIGCDVAFVQVSPPNADGDHSFGLINDFVHQAVAKARVVIAEVNECVPFTHGDVVLHAAQIDCAVRVERSPVELMPAKIGETDQAIARVVAGYIEDGAVLQVGIGAVPDAILRLLHDRRDLGFHSGMLGDALIDLVEAGVVTNALKPFDAGVSITTALIGTERIYKFANRNPRIAVRSSAYTHGAEILARLPNLVAINSAIEVDLTGQVNAEQSGAHYLGGTGGQVDFVRAGSRSPGGHSIVALPATAKGGKLSRITVNLSGPVTTARSDVDVIVTEFGAAELKGQTLAERTRRMIAIAHPSFREELDRAAHTIQQRGF
jgi:acyl-CoA hydrolase